MADSDEELLDGIRYWARIMNERGHAPMFARKTPEDLAIVERSTAREWCRAVHSKYGLNVDNVTSNPDPKGVPDCFANLNGQEISIELTELVDGPLLDQICDAQGRGQVISAHVGEAFLSSLWDEQRFNRALSDRFSAKSNKYLRNNEVVDALIIHTDEPWLSPQQVEEWIPHCELKPTNQIKSAYLLMTYAPGYSIDWPVFQICSS